MITPPGTRGDDWRDDWRDDWLCPDHGPVTPMHPASAPTPAAIRRVARESGVPVWLPWPLPEGWLISGIRWAGAERRGPVAVVLAVSGPNPLPESVQDGVGDDRVADLLLVAEQPGIGLGAHLAGLSELDPGIALREMAEREPAHMKMVAAGHDVPLWSVPMEGGVGYVGEAAGEWLWVLAWPGTAVAVLLERFALVDLRTPDHEFDLPCGALTPRLG